MSNSYAVGSDAGDSHLPGVGSEGGVSQSYGASIGFNTSSPSTLSAIIHIWLNLSYNTANLLMYGLPFSTYRFLKDHANASSSI